VQENWRRQGVGSALIAAAMTLARQRGSAKFWLSTGGHNTPAQALYESLGGDRKPRERQSADRQQHNGSAFGRGGQERIQVS
jgi:ribosomal protein S18 acetylase RimI-like enzyme